MKKNIGDTFDKPLGQGQYEENEKRKRKQEELRRKEINLQEKQTKILEEQKNFNKCLIIVTIILAIIGIGTIIIELIKLGLGK